MFDRCEPHNCPEQLQLCQLPVKEGKGERVGEKEGVIERDGGS